MSDTGKSLAGAVKQATVSNGASAMRKKRKGCSEIDRGHGEGSEENPQSRAENKQETRDGMTVRKQVEMGKIVYSKPLK